MMGKSTFSRLRTLALRKRIAAPALDTAVDWALDHNYTLAEATEMFRSKMLLHSLVRTNWNISKAAGAVGVHRNTLTRNLQAELDRTEERDA